MINYTKKGTNAENIMQISLLLKQIWYLKDSRNDHFAMHYSSFANKYSELARRQPDVRDFFFSKYYVCQCKVGKGGCR